LIDIDYAITPLIAHITIISDTDYYAIAAIIIDAITPHYYFLLLLYAIISALIIFRLDTLSPYYTIADSHYIFSLTLLLTFSFSLIAADSHMRRYITPLISRFSHAVTPLNWLLHY
jgi:hypothetical protein